MSMMGPFGYGSAQGAFSGTRAPQSPYGPAGPTYRPAGPLPAQGAFGMPVQGAFAAPSAQGQFGVGSAVGEFHGGDLWYPPTQQTPAATWQPEQGRAALGGGGGGLAPQQAAPSRIPSIEQQALGAGPNASRVQNLIAAMQAVGAGRNNASMVSQAPQQQAPAQLLGGQVMGNGSAGSVSYADGFNGGPNRVSYNQGLGAQGGGITRLGGTAQTGASQSGYLDSAPAGYGPPPQVPGSQPPGDRQPQNQQYQPNGYGPQGGQQMAPALGYYGGPAALVRPGEAQQAAAYGPAPQASQSASPYGYAAPQQGYGAPQQGYAYGGPQQAYGAPAPQQAYGAPAMSYAGAGRGYAPSSPSMGYGAPQLGYGSPFGAQQGYGQQAYGAPQQASYAVSDERAKEHVQSADDKLEAFLSEIGAHSYEYKDPAHGKGRFVSPMAQELERTELGRSAVVERPDGLKMVDYGRTQGIALAALALQHQRQRSMTDRIKALESRIGLGRKKVA